MNLMESSQRGVVLGNGMAHVKSVCKVQERAEPGKRESADSVDVALYRSVPDSAQTVPDIGVTVPDSVALRAGIIFEHIERHGHISEPEVATLLAVKERRARSVLKEMMDYGLLGKRGIARQTIYLKAKG